MLNIQYIYLYTLCTTHSLTLSHLISIKCQWMMANNYFYNDLWSTSPSTNEMDWSIWIGVLGAPALHPFACPPFYNPPEFPLNRSVTAGEPCRLHVNKWDTWLQPVKPIMYDVHCPVTSYNSFVGSFELTECSGHDKGLYNEEDWHVRTNMYPCFVRCMEYVACD